MPGLHLARDVSTESETARISFSCGIRAKVATTLRYSCVWTGVAASMICTQKVIHMFINRKPVACLHIVLALYVPRTGIYRSSRDDRAANVRFSVDFLSK